MLSIIKILFCFSSLVVAALVRLPLVQLDVERSCLVLYDYSLLYLVCFILSNIFRNNYAGIAVVLYLITGLAGLPVFAFGGGLSYIHEPSFGYLLALLPLSIVSFYFRYYVDRFPLMTANNKSLGPILGLILAHAIGLVYLCVKKSLNLESFLGMSIYQLFYDVFFAWIVLSIIPDWRSPVQRDEVLIHKAFRKELV